MIVIYFQSPAFAEAKERTRYRVVIRRGEMPEIEACGRDKLGQDAWGRAEPEALDVIDILQAAMLGPEDAGVVSHVHLGDL